MHAGFDQSELESAAHAALHCGATRQNAEVVAAHGEADLNFGGATDIQMGPCLDIAAEFAQIADFASKQEAGAGDCDLGESVARMARGDATFGGLVLG